VVALADNGRAKGPDKKRGKGKNFEKPGKHRLGEILQFEKRSNGLKRPGKRTVSGEMRCVEVAGWNVRVGILGARSTRSASCNQ